jgi:hypothetical protein
MGFESTHGMETKEFCGAARPSKELKRKERNSYCPLNAPKNSRQRRNSPRARVLANTWKRALVFLGRYGKQSAGLEACLGWIRKNVIVFGSSKTNLCGHAFPIDSYPREDGLFPVRPRVALLLVLLPAQSLDAKAL